MPYDIGDAVTITTRVRDSSGVLTDTTPNPVLTVTRPDGTTATPSITRTGVGQYQGTAAATLAGTWTYIWVSTGTIVAAEPGQFSVAASGVFVASLEELKAHLNRNPAIDADYLDDNELRTFLSAATRIVENYIGPISVRTFTERFVSNSGVGFSGVITPQRIPLISVTSITPDNGTVINVADPLQVTVDTDVGVILLNLNWVPTGVVVYKAGRVSIPDSAKLAGMIIAAHMWETQNGGAGLPFPGDTSQVVISGSGFSIPNRAKELLAGDGMNVGGIA